MFLQVKYVPAGQGMFTAAGWNKWNTFGTRLEHADLCPYLQEHVEHVFFQPTADKTQGR